MKDLLREIAELTSEASTQPTPTPIPGVVIIKGEVPQYQLAAMYEPMIGLVVHGGKTISIGESTIDVKGPAYFLVPMEMPVSGRVHQGADGQPYLSVALRLNEDALLDLLKDLPDDFRLAPPGSEFTACAADRDFVEAWVRMLRLRNDPTDIPALAPVYEREILYRVLRGPQGWRLKQLCLERGQTAKVRQSVQWIRGNHAKSLDVKRMAVKAGMGVTTFHRQFKRVTGLSPLQFQKQLRLLEARKLLVFGDHSVAEAAFEVGYESASQFNREYSRFFGDSPARDAAAVKEMEKRRWD